MVTNEIKMEISRNSIDLGKKNEDTKVKTILRGKFIDLSAYISKRKTFTPTM